MDGSHPHPTEGRRDEVSASVWPPGACALEGASGGGAEEPPGVKDGPVWRKVIYRSVQ